MCHHILQIRTYCCVIFTLSYIGTRTLYFLVVVFFFFFVSLLAGPMIRKVSAASISSRKPLCYTRLPIIIVNNRRLVTKYFTFDLLQVRPPWKYHYFRARCYINESYIRKVINFLRVYRTRWPVSACTYTKSVTFSIDRGIVASPSKGYAANDSFMSLASSMYRFHHPCLSIWKITEKLVVNCATPQPSWNRSITFTFFFSYMYKLRCVQIGRKSVTVRDAEKTEGEIRVLGCVWVNIVVN